MKCVQPYHAVYVSWRHMYARDRDDTVFAHAHCINKELCALHVQFALHRPLIKKLANVSNISTCVVKVYKGSCQLNEVLRSC